MRLLDAALQRGGGDRALWNVTCHWLKMQTQAESLLCFKTMESGGVAVSEKQDLGVVIGRLAASAWDTRN